MPGLWDQHVHMGQWAANAARLDLASHVVDQAHPRSHPDAAQRLRIVERKPLLGAVDHQDLEGEGLARVPQHRAALERQVRAQTGLDVRFNELGVRLGWYGPEAVFRRVAAE